MRWRECRPPDDGTGDGRPGDRRAQSDNDRRCCHGRSNVATDRHRDHGDPLGTGSGGDRVPSEYNDLPFTLGAVGIARGQDPALNNDSQWFVVKRDSTFLDKQYTNCGMVTSGMDVVQKIAIGDKIKTITVR